MQPAPFNSAAGFQMLLFRFFCFQIVLLASLAVPISHAFAQREDMSIGDQPGYIPNAADEELPLQFRRQVVLYRSTEAPGTIIVHTAERFHTSCSMQKRKVDVLSRNTTWNLSRETNYALHFAAVSYYDGQGFMVPKSREVESALKLVGAKVCVQSGTTTELNLADYFRANNMKYQEMKFAKMDDVFKAYDGGQCDVLTTDVSRLYALRLKFSKPSDHVILPDVISKEPLAPVVR